MIILKHLEVEGVLLTAAAVARPFRSTTRMWSQREVGEVAVVVMEALRLHI
jgi:hypothetical protein